jgi:sulfite exporter TauE/SafE
MFVLGLGTSLHCVSMCGPLVLTYAVKGEEDGPWYRKLTPNVAYQSAKVVSYMLVGLLLGAVGSFFDLDGVRPYVMYLAGAFMIVLGLGMTGKVPWAARFTPRPPRWLMALILKLRRRADSDAQTGESRLTTPVFFGLMTGLLPCGPLMAAQVSAATSGSAITGSLGMAAFAVGTAPLMIAFGTAGSLIPRQWKQRMMTALAVGVIIFGLVFINRGLMLTGAPVNFDTVKTAVVGGPVAGTGEFTRGADGVAEVPLVIENVRFAPQVLSIPADEPVRIIVDRREANACSDQVMLPQLGVLVDVAPFAVTTIELPPTSAGAYTLTCGMGMMSGQLIVGDGAAGGASPLVWLALLLAAVVGAVVLVRRRSMELLVIVAGLAIAVLAGLALGGMFN